MRNLFTLIAAILVSIGAHSQAGFEGTIDFQIGVSGEDIEQMKKNFPTNLTLKIKENKMFGKNTGGELSKMFSGFIFDGDENSIYLLSPALQTAMKVQSTQASSESAPKVEVTKTTETTTIAGHSCTKYILKESEGRKGTIEIWATEDFNVEKPKDLGNLTGNMFMQGIDGFPLKVVTSQEGTEIKMEVREVRKETIDPSNFILPSGYRVQPLDFSLLSTMLPGLGN